MAVTRIKNNQIVDSTITGTKLVQNTVTGGLLEDNLTYGSNLTISGNLTVSGTTTTVDTTNTLIADPLFVLSRGETGTPSADSGIVIERGTSTNVAFIWDESEDVFAVVNTSEDGNTAGDVTISSYADLTVANLIASGVDLGNIGVSGNDIISTDANGNINLTPNGSGEVVASTLTVSDLTASRVVLAGTSGAIEDSGNLTFDGSTLTVTGDVSASGDLGSATATISGNATVGGTLGVTGEATLASATISDLTSGRILTAGTSGAIEDTADLTMDGTTFGVGSTGEFTVDVASGNTDIAGTLAVDGNVTLTLAIDVSGLASLDGGIDVGGAFTVADTSGNVSTSGTLAAGNTTITGTIDTSGLASLDGGIDVDGAFTVADTTGNISTSGTLGVTGESTLASATISDLTSGRVVLAGTAGSLEDSGNLTFDGSTLTVTGDVSASGDLGGATATVSGNATVGGTLGVTGEATLASATVSDLTSGRLTYAGTGGALQDDANLTWSGFALDVTGGVDITGDLDIDNINIDGNDITSTNSNGNINITPDGTGVTNIKNLKLDGLTADRVLVTDTNGATATNDNLTFDGTDLGLTGALTVDNITVDGDTISSVHSEITIDPSTAGAGGTVIIAGNLQVTGTTTTVDSTVVTIADPLFQLGADSDDALDRGITALYNDGASKTAFFGMDDSALEFVFIPDATDSASVISGSLGSAAFGSMRVTDLTSGRIVTVGSNGELQDADTFTFNGTTLAVTALEVDNVQIDGNTITTTAGNLLLDSFGNEVIIDSVAVSDLTSGRVVLAGESGAIEDSGNLTFDGSTLTVTGDVSASGDLGGATATISGNATVGGTFGVTGATTLSSTLGVTGESTLASATVSDLTSGRITLAGTAGSLEDSANLTFDGSTLTVTGDVSASGDLGGATATISGNATVGGTLGVTGATTLSDTLGVTGATTLSSTLDVTGNTNLNSTTGSTSTTSGALVVDGGVGIAENLYIGGDTNITGELATATANIGAGDIIIDGLTLDVTIPLRIEGDNNFNITNSGATEVFVVDGATGNTTVGGTLDATGAATLSSTLDVTGESTLASATVSDLTDGRVVLAGTAGSLEDSANLTFDGSALSVTGSLVVDNVTVDGNSITSSNALTFDAAAGQSIVINESGADVDVRIESDTQVNAFVVEGSTGNIGIRTSAPAAGAVLHINTTDSIIVPNGTTAQRPGTAAEGMMRYNSTLGQLEFYDSTEWKVAGAEFTIMVADSFDGDGSTVAFTLSEDSTSAGLIVSINGVLQDPGTAYSVSGSTLTFTEAPQTGDNIDARIITTTVSVTQLADADTNMNISDADGEVTININGSTVGTFDSTGLTVVGSVSADSFTGLDATKIEDGTSNVEVLATNGNIAVDVAGTTVANFASTGAELSGTPTAPTASAGTSTTQIATTAFVGTAVSNLVDSAPAALDTLNELAAALGDDANFSTTVTNSIATKLPLAGGTMSGDLNMGGNDILNAGTINGTATSAQYADLAEKYTADAEYAPGTVVSFGGDAEVTVTDVDMDRKVAGVVSTDPAHLMNAGLESANVVDLALQGRVPCKVTGAVEKGDLMVAAGNGFARAEADPKVGTVIGKALEAHAGGEGVIEVAVGRF